MGIITVRFTSKWPPDPTSLIIARLGGSRKFSHVMNIIDGVAYEATILHGCRNVPVEVAMRGVAYYQDMFVDVPDIDAAIEWGKQTDGLSYDFAGAFGIPLLMSEDWNDESSYWCSERVFMQILKTGMKILDPDVIKRVTPEHLRMCNFKKTAIIYAKNI